MKPNIDWVIHGCANGVVCEIDGMRKLSFILTIAMIVMAVIIIPVNKPEIAEGKCFEKINEYLDRSILEIEEQIKSLPSSHEQSWDELNELFLSIVK